MPNDSADRLFSIKPCLYECNPYKLDSGKHRGMLCDASNITTVLSNTRCALRTQLKNLCNSPF